MMYAPIRSPASRKTKLVLMYRRISGVILVDLALGYRAESLPVGKDEPAAVLIEDAVPDPAAQGPNGGLHCGAGHVGQTLPSEVKRQRDALVATRPFALREPQQGRGQAC